MCLPAGFRIATWGTRLISFMTGNLCAAFYPIMNSRIGSYLVSRCINHSSAEDNKLLYEAAISCCLDLTPCKAC